jgi:hypothetical protein
MIVYGPKWEFDDRVYTDEGVVYDLGCLRWDWLQPFLGRKRLVGVDPHERTAPAGCELVRAAIAPYAGSVTMHGAGLQAECCSPAVPYQIPVGYAEGRPENTDTGVYEVPAITWPELLAEYGPAAMVKINIEGAEIPLLMTAKQPMAPQLVVAFHRPGQDYSQPNWPQNEAIDACIAYLGSWYDARYTILDHSAPDKWWHFTLK